MPKLNGVQVIEQIRKLIKDNNENIADSDRVISEPVFVIQTAYYSQAFRKFVEGSIVQGVYEKPMKKESIVEVLRTIVGNSHLNNRTFIESNRGMWFA